MPMHTVHAEMVVQPSNITSLVPVNTIDTAALSRALAPVLYPGTGTHLWTQMRAVAKLERSVINSACSPQEMLNREVKAIRTDRNKMKVHQTELKAVMFAIQQLSVAIGVKEERVRHLNKVLHQVNSAKTDRFKERRAAQQAKDKAARSRAAETLARSGVAGDFDEEEVKEAPNAFHVSEEAEEKNHDGPVIDDEAEEINDEDEGGSRLGLNELVGALEDNEDGAVAME